MHRLTIPFLIAASEMLDKIKDVIPKLAHQVSVSLQEVFYYWMSARGSKKVQKGTIKNTN